jgi:hypothetical protein
MMAKAYSRLAYSGVWKTLSREEKDSMKPFNMLKIAISSLPAGLVSLHRSLHESYKMLFWIGQRFDRSGGETSPAEEVVEVGRKDLGHVKRSGSPHAVGSVFYSLSKAPFFFPLQR